MATIVNNPPASDNSGNGMGFLFGIILLILFVVGFFYYGLPLIRNSVQSSTVNVPGKVDVNVHTNK